MTTSANVPGVYDVAIDGRDYMIDTQYQESFRYQTIDPIRRQADTSDSVGEASLNPEGFWRRSPPSFHKGAGQPRYDATDSDPDRFKNSVGVDVWTEGQLSLLKDTAEDFDVGQDVLGAVAAANSGEYYVRLADGTIRKLNMFTGFSSYGPVSLTGVTDMASLNGQLFVVNSGHLYKVDASTATAWITSDPSNFIYVSAAAGRLVAATSAGNSYDVSATGLSTLPSVLLDTPLLGGTSVNGTIYLFEFGKAGDLQDDSEVGRNGP
jgi:hypothetical protein